MPVTSLQVDSGIMSMLKRGHDQDFRKVNRVFPNVSVDKFLAVRGFYDELQKELYSTIHDMLMANYVDIDGMLGTVRRVYSRCVDTHGSGWYYNCIRRSLARSELNTHDVTVLCPPRDTFMQSRVVNYEDSYFARADWYRAAYNLVRGADPDLPNLDDSIVHDYSVEYSAHSLMLHEMLEPAFHGEDGEEIRVDSYALLRRVPYLFLPPIFWAMDDDEREEDRRPLIAIMCSHFLARFVRTSYSHGIRRFSNRDAEYHARSLLAARLAVDPDPTINVLTGEDAQELPATLSAWIGENATMIFKLSSKETSERAKKIYDYTIRHF